MPAQFIRGNVVRVTAQVLDKSSNPAGVPADPATIKFRCISPRTKTETIKTYPTDPEVVRTGTGLFHFDKLVDETGQWFFRWESTGVIAANEDYVGVPNTKFS